MTITAATETAIDPTVETELRNNLFVTDAQLLVRPARPGQYHRYATHDSDHANLLLELGYDMDCYGIHIASQAGVDASFRLLDDVFRVFLDMLCLDLWCDAIVDFIVGDQVMLTQSYGFDDGDHTFRISVYCDLSDDGAEALLASMEEDMIVLRPDSSELGCRASLRTS